MTRAMYRNSCSTWQNGGSKGETENWKYVGVCIWYIKNSTFFTYISIFRSRWSFTLQGQKGKIHDRVVTIKKYWNDRTDYARTIVVHLSFSNSTFLGNDSMLTKWLRAFWCKISLQCFWFFIFMWCSLKLEKQKMTRWNANLTLENARVLKYCNSNEKLAIAQSILVLRHILASII